MTKNIQLLTSYENDKGVNDLTVVRVMSGWEQLAVFTGKTAKKRATTLKNKLLTPNHSPVK
jgi:hypothetical protein